MFKSRKMKQEIASLKEQVADLKLQKKMEEREIEQLVKMKEEKNKLEQDQKLAQLQESFREKEYKLRKDLMEEKNQLQEKHYRETLKKLDEFRGEVGAFSKEMLARLPNVNMEIRERRGKK